jgi:intracellular sulfur oxidation DsrE/DsrF family protein
MQEEFFKLCELMKIGDLTILYHLESYVKRHNFDLNDLLNFVNSFEAMLELNKVTVAVSYYLRVMRFLHEKIDEKREELEQQAKKLKSYEVNSLVFTQKILNTIFKDKVFPVKAYVYGEGYIRESLGNAIMYSPYQENLEDLYTPIAGHESFSTMSYRGKDNYLRMIGFIPTTLIKVDFTMNIGQEEDIEEDEDGRLPYTWEFHYKMPKRPVQRIAKKHIWPHLMNAFPLSSVSDLQF